MNSGRLAMAMFQTIRPATDWAVSPRIGIASHTTSAAQPTVRTHHSLSRTPRGLALATMPLSPMHKVPRAKGLVPWVTMPHDEPRGRVAWVTGSSRGPGRAIVHGIPRCRRQRSVSPIPSRPLPKQSGIDRGHAQVGHADEHNHVPDSPWLQAAAVLL